MPTDEREAERLMMVETQLHRRGIRDERVLDAMRRVPRHEFIPEKQRRHAYEDHPVAIGAAQTISQPYMVAAMTEILGLTGSERVLEIGTGSGYQTAILAECAALVFTIERSAILAARGRTTLTSLGYTNVRYLVCDGTRGWPEEAPFDGIIVTAAAPEPPPAIVAQIADPGVLVAPVGERGVQDLISIRRREGQNRRIVHFKCAFVPLIGAEGFPD